MNAYRIALLTAVLIGVAGCGGSSNGTGAIIPAQPAVIVAGSPLPGSDAPLPTITPTVQVTPPTNAPLPAPQPLPSSAPTI